MEWMPNISDEGAQLRSSSSLSTFSATAFWHISFSNPEINFIIKFIMYFVWFPSDTRSLPRPALTRLPLTWSQSRRLSAVTWYVFPLSISDVRRLSRRKNHLLNVYRERERVLPPPAWVRARSQHWGIYRGIRLDSPPWQRRSTLKSELS